MPNRRYVQALGSLVVVAALALLSMWSGFAPPTSERTPPGDSGVRDAGVPAPVAPVQSQADFDYYVLVLSWSPTFCASDAGRGRDDDLQCRSGRPHAFVLHGLWPQYERGYPQNCPSEAPRRVSDEAMARVLEVSPSRDLVQHEWEKHGTCSGLSQDDYFAAAVAAFRSINVPSVYTAPGRALTTTPDDVRQAFVDANSGLPSGDLSATCSRNDLGELWVCLDRQLRPRACSAEVSRRHCGGRKLRMLGVRGDWPD